MPTGRLPRLDPEQRLQLAAAVHAPSNDDIRDRAIITSLYWGCFRGEEVAATRWHQLHQVEAGIEWTLPKAKNDQHGQGTTGGLSTNPDPWVRPVTAIADIVQGAATSAGLTGNYGSHSPRSGFTADALDHGAKREHVQTYGGWQNAKRLDSYDKRTAT